MAVAVEESWSGAARAGCCGMCLSVPAEAGGIPSEFASLALEPLRNGYVNGEDIRLDGGLRLGLRRELLAPATWSRSSAV